MKVKIVAGIGSRNTPKGILREMQKLGGMLAKHGVWVRSGHAAGADYAFEMGAGQKCLVFLPWKDFNASLTMCGQVVDKVDLPAAIREVKILHPVGNKLDNAALKLMARNFFQILGPNLDQPCDLVICWTEKGEQKGGTGFSMKIAEANNIPVINMYHHNTAFKVLDEIAKIKRETSKH
jgi:hypothetical protein